MNKSKLKNGVIVALILSNILLIVFFVLTKSKHPKHPKPRDIIIQKLEFDKKQIESYDVLIQVHRKSIQQKDSKIKYLKNKLFVGLGTDETEAYSDSVCVEITNVKDEIEHLHLNHFKDIKKLCTEKQLPKFKDLTKDLARIFSPKPPSKK